MRPERFCACGCGQSLDGMRLDAKWKSASCKAAAKRGTAPIFNSRGKKRRKSRDGDGVRVYLSERELALLVHLVDKASEGAQPGPRALAIRAKLEDAQGRAERRSAARKADRDRRAARRANARRSRSEGAQTPRFGLAPRELPAAAPRFRYELWVDHDRERELA